MQPSPYANQLRVIQYCVPILAKGKVPHKLPEFHVESHLPAITVLPAHEFNIAHECNINLRAPAQSSRYIAARLKGQETKDVMRDDIPQVEDVEVVSACHDPGSPTIAEEQDADAAEILVKAAQKQHATCTPPDIGKIPINTSDNPAAGASMDYPHKCPVISCRKGFWLKAERDRHTMEHFEGDILCGMESCRLGKFTCPRFSNLEDLAIHVYSHHFYDISSSRSSYYRCSICFGNFAHREPYMDHFVKCIIHTVELEASGRAQACPVSFCDHHSREFPSEYHRDLHMKQHHRTLFDCNWCHHPSGLYEMNTFKSHVLEEHSLSRGLSSLLSRRVRCI